MNLQRRNILRGGLAAALTLPVAGVQAVEYTKDLKWDKTADVVVLGYGGAGACAAIEAHDAGAKSSFWKSSRRAAATRPSPRAAS